MRYLTHSKKSWLALAAALAAMLAAAFGAFGYFSSTGSGTGFTTTGTLGAPSITSGTPGGGTVALNWSTVSAPAGGSVTYYVRRDGAAPSGDCPTAASPTGVTSCTDSGVAIGSHDYTVTAVWRTWTATSATRTFTVTTGPLNHFLVTPTGVHETAGSPFGVTVTAKDSLNNTITTYAGTIHFTSNDGQAVLPGDYAFTTGAGNDNGVHTFTNGVTLKTAGSGKTVMVSDGGNTGTATYTVDPGAATQISLTGSTSDLTSGTARTFTVTLADAYGNTAATGVDSAASVTFSQVSGLGSVGGTGAAAAVAGVATKNLTGQLAGPVTVQATATLSGSGSTTSNTVSFNVVHGSATQIALSGSTADLASGSARTFTATIEDAAGNTVTDGVDSTVSVNFAQTGGTGSLSGTGSAPAAAGIATKNLTGVLAGPVTVAASGTLSGPGSTNSNTLTFDVVAGPVSQLAFTMQPSGASGGTAFTTQPVVAAKDAAGNTVTGYAGSVALSIKSGTGTAGATLSGCTPSLVSGVTSFTGCKIDKSGSGYQLTATDGTRSVDSNAFTVAVGAAAKLAFTTSPSNSSAGTTFGTQPVVTAQDAGGNTVTTDSSTVTLSIVPGTPTSGGPGTLSGCTQTESAGVVTFSGCKIDVAGTGYKLRATDGGLTAADSASFNVTGTATSLVLSAATTTPTAGAADNLTITAKDSGGNTVTSYTGSKNLTFGGANIAPDGTTRPTVTNNSGTAINFGTATAITFTNGVATVTGGGNGVMTLYKAETANISVTDGSINNNGNLLAVTVNVGAAARYAWTTVTANGTVGNPCYFTCSITGEGNNKTASARVSVTDSAGNIVSGLGAGHTVTVAFTTNQSGGNVGSGNAQLTTLTISSTGAATSTATFTYTSGSGTTWSDALSATTAAGTTYTTATLSISK